MIGMNSELMKEYIKFVADYTIMMLGYQPMYHSQNPFAFMEFASLEGKTNFFEKRVSEYSKAVVSTDDFKVDIDGDF
jgi:ribonucleotide reductase beta subunit family protein with ferritin-like domain